MSQPHEPVRVSVVIPVLNDAERLRTCLEALGRQTWNTAELEVLVVDNGSARDPAEVTGAFPFVRLLREPAPGSYAARNTALARATGDVLAFTDSDCIPEPDWVEQGVRALQRLGQHAVVGGNVVLFADDAARPTLAEEFELAIGFSQRSYVEEKHYSVTANLFTTPQAFAKVGSFDATLKSGGDKEWGMRAHRAGMVLHYAEGAIVRHPARRSLQELLHKRARVVGGHLTMARARYPHWLAFTLELGKACLPPAKRVLRARDAKTGRTGSLKRALKVAAVGVTLQAYSALELVRLQLGKPPVR